VLPAGLGNLNCDKFSSALEQTNSAVKASGCWCRLPSELPTEDVEACCFAR
jgi:hypothetical protein